MFKKTVTRMKTSFKILAGVLLLLIGLSAIYGGLNLMVYPNGTSLQLPLELLEHSPFKNYLVPGIILFIANGLLSLFVWVALISRLKKYPLYIFIQGNIVTGWIIIQLIMLQVVNVLNIIIGVTGLLLIFCGWILRYPTRDNATNGRIKFHEWA